MLIKALGNYLRGGTTSPRCEDNDEPREFLTLIIQLDTSIYGWKRYIAKLQNWLGSGVRHYNSDRNGRVRASVWTVDSKKVIRRITRSSMILELDYDVGTCSDHLFFKEPAASSSSVQQQQLPPLPFPQDNYNSYYQPHNTYNRGGRGYGNHMQLPPTYNNRGGGGGGRGYGHGYGNHMQLPPY